MTLSIEVNRLQLRYGAFTALMDITFQLDGGKIYGLIGWNGSGKTSLLSILASYRKQTDGQVSGARLHSKMRASWSRFASFKKAAI